MKKLLNLFLIGLTAVFLFTGCKGNSSESDLDLVRVNISTDFSLGRAIINPVASEQYSDNPVSLTVSNGTRTVFFQDFNNLADMHSNVKILLLPNSYTFSLEIYDKTKTTVILLGEVVSEISLENSNVVIPLNFTEQETNKIVEG